MKAEDVVDTLSKLERQVLPNLENNRLVSELANKSGMKVVEAMRACQWLENKGVVKLENHNVKTLTLDKFGQEAFDKGMPEKRLLKAIKDSKKSLEQLEKEASMIKPELYATMGVLKGKVAINILKEGKSTILEITSQGLKLLNKDSLEEQLMKKIVSEKNLDPNSLESEWKFALDNLNKRKQFIKIVEKKDKKIMLTSLGRELLKIDLKKLGNITDKLTSEQLKTGKWKELKFRKFDVSSSLPKVEHGKKHFVNEAIEYVKQIWLDLGFQEMRGSHVQSAFWDLDTLFVPQDHPAREMQDTFYLENPKTSDLNKDADIKKLVKEVKKVHEDGGDTGSLGWRYNFSEEEASKNLLRTHTTVISAQTLFELKKKFKGKNVKPGKYFIVGKVYRNEAMDWKHLFEFHQVDGIVIDENANFKNLKGYLREFFTKMGFLDIRLRPAHFPYTEPSVEVDVLHPVKKEWVELGGAGIFRPEVTKTLIGKEIPVLAWGLGLERIISDYYGITDIRELYGNDLQELKEKKLFLK